MNKDVIYIEPEDDITDIITKIEKAKNKIVALVPPKKAGVFRSIVNIKLIAKAGATAEKTVVLVTTDPSITKLAGATKLPVAESLQSAPSVPKVLAEDEVSTTAEEVVTEDAEEDAEDESGDTDDAKEGEEEKAEETETDEADDKDAEKDEDGENADDASAEKDKKDGDKKSKDKNAKKVADGFKGWVQNHKKMLIFGGCFGVVLIIALVWAFGFAPAVDISVAIKTDQKNFSENVTFVTNLTDENAKEGKFYIEEKRIEDVKEVAFEATGQKNEGEKATGEIIVYDYFKESGTTPIAAGSKFTINGLAYLADANTTLSWDGEDSSKCDNKSDDPVKFMKLGCLVSARIKVTAAESGEKYNIGAYTSGWVPSVGVAAAYSDKAITGGTDEFITIVQQSDVEKAKGELDNSSESVNKAKLIASVSDDKLVIESSFKQETSEAVATPGVDEEVKEGEKPVLKTTTVATLYVLDKVKLEEFIEEKVTLGENQSIYDIQNVYLDNFIETDGGYTAKLKAQYFIGPKITESELVEKILGKGIGDARREISDIYGVSEVKINTSYPWVMTVPGDSNKVTITFEVKDQNGNSTEKSTTSTEKSDGSDEE